MLHRILLLTFSVVFALARPKICNADNCYRDIIASNFPSRSGRADCSSYLAVTITPSTSTIVSTVTVTEVASTMIEQTATETEFDVASTTSLVSVSASTTVISFTTETSTIQRPTTVIQTIADTATVYTTISTTIGVTQLAKRQQAVLPSAIPQYASHCAAVSRYISACSCAGVSGSTTTLLTPTSIVIRTATITPTTISTTTIVATESITQISSTFVELQTTTVTTLTHVVSSTSVDYDFTVPITTQTVTSVVATTTIPVSTTTITNIVTIPTLAGFRLVVSAASGSTRIGNYIGLVGGNTGLGFTDLAGSAVFGLDSSNVLTVGGVQVNIRLGRCGGSALVGTAPDVGLELAVCQINKQTLQFTCPTVQEPNLSDYGYGNSLTFARVSCSTGFPSTFQLITLTAVLT